MAKLDPVKMAWIVRQKEKSTQPKDCSYHEDIIDRIDDAMLDNDLRNKLRGESEELVKEMEEIKAKTKEEAEKIKKSKK